MTSATEEKLGKLAHHSIWTRDLVWLRKWHDDIFVPACSEGTITAPLAALDICSALDRGVQREGEFAAKREGYAQWLRFLGEINQSGSARDATARSLVTQKATAIHRRTLRAFSLALMNENWVATHDYWTSSGPSLAGRLLDAEVARLDGRNQTDSLDELWAVIDAAAVGGRLSNCLPPSIWAYLRNRTSKPIDPFLFSLLESFPEAESLTAPSIVGSNPQAIHHRRRIGPSGEFARRDLGSLPSNLARLAPTELMFFSGSAKAEPERITREAPTPRGRKSNGRFTSEPARGTGSALRSLFVMKTIEGRLLQRFSYEADPSTMEPSAMLQVEIADCAEYHLLPADDGVPMITWFRAVAVHLANTFARIAARSRWSVTTALVHSFNGRHACGLLPPNSRDSLASSCSDALDFLTLSNPRAFQSGWPGAVDRPAPEAKRRPEIDYCLRIVLGAPEAAAELPGGLLVNARQQCGVRIERAPNGNWGLESASETAAAPTLGVRDLEHAVDDPAEAAQIILRSVFERTSGHKGEAL
jgi:hypothetical protein